MVNESMVMRYYEQRQDREVYISIVSDGVGNRAYCIANAQDIIEQRLAASGGFNKVSSDTIDATNGIDRTRN